MRQNDNLPARHAGRNNLSTYQGGSRRPDLLQSPWQMLRGLHGEMDRVFGEFMGGFPSFSGFPSFPSFNDPQWSPSMDISQTDNEWRVEADLPGVNEEDIHVSVNNGYLTLTAEMRQSDQPDEKGSERRYQQRERRYGYFERVLPLPPEVDEEKISCDFKNGVLSLHLPKSEKALTQGRRIPIGKGSVETGTKNQGSSPGQMNQPAQNAAGNDKTAKQPHEQLAGAKSGQKRG